MFSKSRKLHGKRQLGRLPGARLHRVPDPGSTPSTAPESVNPEEIRKALVATNIPGDQLIMTWDGVKFDEKGQNTRVRPSSAGAGRRVRHTIPWELAAEDALSRYPRGRTASSGPAPGRLRPAGVS